MRTTLFAGLAVSAVALLVSAAPALAEMQSFSATLSGAEEVPPTESTGTGTVTADYDTDTKLFKWTVSYEGLTGPATAAHFHGPADPGANASPVVPVDLTAAAEAEPEAEPESLAEAEPEAPAEAEPAAPDEAAPISPIAGEVTLTEEQAADLLAGKWYFNIHTDQYPDGELRGQLPAPAN